MIEIGGAVRSFRSMAVAARPAPFSSLTTASLSPGRVRPTRGISGCFAGRTIICMRGIVLAQCTSRRRLQRRTAFILRPSTSDACDSANDDAMTCSLSLLRSSCRAWPREAAWAQRRAKAARSRAWSRRASHALERGARLGCGAVRSSRFGVVAARGENSARSEVRCWIAPRRVSRSASIAPLSQPQNGLKVGFERTCVFDQCRSDPIPNLKDFLKVLAVGIVDMGRPAP